MASETRPQIYLITPPALDLDLFPGQLAAVLDSTEVACVRLALASRDQDIVARAADALREVTHARDVALVIEGHLVLAERLGLDGVHLNDGARSVRQARKDLGDDAIVGAFCRASRHDGISAGEAGADYVAFGPVGASDLGDGSRAEARAFRLVVRDDRSAGGGRRRARLRTDCGAWPGHGFLRHRRRDLARRKPRCCADRPDRSFALRPCQKVSNKAGLIFFLAKILSGGAGGGQPPAFVTLRPGRQRPASARHPSATRSEGSALRTSASQCAASVLRFAKASTRTGGWNTTSTEPCLRAARTCSRCGAKSMSPHQP